MLGTLKSSQKKEHTTAHAISAFCLHINISYPEITSTVKISLLKVIILLLVIWKFRVIELLFAIWKNVIYHLFNVLEIEEEKKEWVKEKMPKVRSENTNRLT